jgi:acetolactate synthase-1/2/3 large subunit
VLGRIYRTDLALAADPVATLEALAERKLPGWPAWAATLHKAARPFVNYQPRQPQDGVDFGAMVQALARHAPADAILTTDAGNFGSWVHSLWPWNGRQLCVGAVSGAMGLGVPGAVAACLRHPSRTVLAFVGDGGLMMTGNEIATAIAAGAAPKIIVSNNGGYATIRLHQEKFFPGRPSGTGLVNPNFARWAESFGARGILVERPEDVDEAAREALAERRPVVVDVRSSMEAISIFTTIAQLRGAA